MSKRLAAAIRRRRRIPPGAIRIELPDMRQHTDFTCGASSFQAVAGYFGVLPRDCEEGHVASAMGVARDVGAHPHNIIAGIKAYGLRYREIWPMSDRQLLEYLDRRIPVIMMIQAWRTIDRRRRRWRGWASEFDEGHWVVAIGYDNDGVYFEDPSLAAIRGFLTYEDLWLRWHDIGPYWRRSEAPGRRRYQRFMYQYGLAVWKPGARALYYERAEHIT